MTAPENSPTSRHCDLMIFLSAYHQAIVSSPIRADDGFSPAVSIVDVLE
jgi:hypothetical protein